jgi:hypothetical protein
LHDWGFSIGDYTYTLTDPKSGGNQYRARVDVADRGNNDDEEDGIQEGNEDGGNQGVVNNERLPQLGPLFITDLQGSLAGHLVSDGCLMQFTRS